MSWTSELKLHEEPLPHYSMKQIEELAPPGEWDRLCVWTEGQTMCLSPDGSSGIYKWDFDRWLRQGKKTEQGANWD